MLRVISISMLFSLFFSQQAFCVNNEVLSKTMCFLGKKVDKYPFYVYKDYASPENMFFPTGYMGDFNDMQIQPNDTKHQYAGTSCVRITYRLRPHKQAGWTGFFWQYPANNWGDMPGGYDLSQAKRFTFWAKGERGGEVINTLQVGGISGKYPDTGIRSTGQIILSNKWKQYTIELTNLDTSIIIGRESRECWPFMKPLSRIVGGFGWATSLWDNKNKAITFYLDELRFEDD